MAAPVFFGIMFALLSLLVLWLCVLIVREVQREKQQTLIYNALRKSEDEIIERLIKRFSQWIELYRKITDETDALVVTIVDQELHNDDMKRISVIWCWLFT